MANNSGQSSLPIAPPLLIGLCILGAVITVIVTAALYKLCRRATVEVDQEAGEKTWKPNQRSVEQSRYMEEVRLRNKMFAWERARAGRSGSHEQDRDDKRYKGKEVSGDEHMEDISLNDNPYEEMVDDCIKRQSHHFDKPSPQRPCVQRMAPEEFLPVDFQMPTPPHTAVQRDMDRSQINKPGIKIAFNDEEDDDEDDSLADLETRHNSYWPPRRSRMFRSSSVYSGDALLPSTHLHMVHSSSSYAFGKAGPSNNTRD